MIGCKKEHLREAESLKGKDGQRYNNLHKTASTKYGVFQKNYSFILVVCEIERHSCAP